MEAEALELNYLHKDDYLTNEAVLSPESNQSDRGLQLELLHDGSAASIVHDESQQSTPWSPNSLRRAKSAFVYKDTLNDTLLVRSRTMLIFTDWVPYFTSLQQDHLLLFTSRERWEQGLQPDRVIELRASTTMSDMSVEVYGNNSTRLFRRRLLEADDLDHWLDQELQVSPSKPQSSSFQDSVTSSSSSSSQCLLDFASASQSSFELWSKAIRSILLSKRRKQERDNQDELSYVSPGQDSKVTLHQSEVWCNRVLTDDRKKIESELRRLVAMERLVEKVTSPDMALLVYEKVSRVHELFAANSHREETGGSSYAKPLDTDVLHFFLDHLKRKYSVFLMLALAFGVEEERIRTAHEKMCVENGALDAGVGGGSGELQHRTVATYGFDDEESRGVYEKYRTAADVYHQVNFGDTVAAEEEDAIMHLPVMLRVAQVRKDKEECRVMGEILEMVKSRLVVHCMQSS